MPAAPAGDRELQLAEERGDVNLLTYCRVKVSWIVLSFFFGFFFVCLFCLWCTPHTDGSMVPGSWAASISAEGGAEGAGATVAAAAAAAGSCS